MMTEFLDACYEAIKVQERSIADTLKSADNIDKLNFEASHQVVFIGAGDSYAVSEFGVWAFRTSGLNAYSASPTEVEYIPLDSDCMVVGISASGRSLSTLKALQVAKKRGARIAVLTDNSEGKAAEEASDLWITKAGVDSYNVSPASPTTTAMAYILKIASEFDSQIQSEIQHDITQLSKIGKDMVAWAEKEGRLIAKMVSLNSPLYIIADGPNYVAAQVGMMKFDEFSIIKGIAALREEFCHHYNLSIKENEQAILITPSPSTPDDDYYLSVLSDTLQMQAHHLHNDLGLSTALVQAIPNTIALQMAAHYTVQRFNPKMDGFKMPHAKAFRIY
jgi:glucosamine 6-phosphate synthetase-like amidotransferase/phosphosugar isomerase protein